MRVKRDNARRGALLPRMTALLYMPAVMAGVSLVLCRSFLSFPAPASENDHLFPALMTPVLYPAVMLSGFTGFLKSRTSIVMLVITAASSGIVLAGNMSGWFSHFSAEPRMWHQGREIKSAGEDAYTVYFNIQNRGRGELKLSLNPVMSPEEISLVLSAQHYDEASKKWVEYPINKLLSERSQSMFPLAVRSGGTLLLEMIFVGPQQPAQPDRAGNPSGKYTVIIADPILMRLYQHEIDVPQFYLAPI